MNDIINQIYSNNNDCITGFINDLQKIINNTKDNILKQKIQNHKIDLDEQKENYNDDNFDISDIKDERVKIKFGKKRKKQQLLEESSEEKKEFYEKLKIKDSDLKSELYKKCINEMIKEIENIINKMNCIINENNKNKAIIVNLISSFQQKEKFNEFKINDKNKQEIKFEDGKYIGQIIN